jgi:hypothetical protein
MQLSLENERDRAASGQVVSGYADQQFFAVLGRLKITLSPAFIVVQTPLLPSPRTAKSSAGSNGFNKSAPCRTAASNTNPKITRCSPGRRKSGANSLSPPHQAKNLGDIIAKLLQPLSQSLLDHGVFSSRASRSAASWAGGERRQVIDRVDCSSCT